MPFFSTAITEFLKASFNNIKRTWNDEAKQNSLAVSDFHNFKTTSRAREDWFLSQETAERLDQIHDVL